MRQLRIFLLLFFISSCSTPNYPAAVIFDLDGVLVEKSGFSTAWNIGFRHFIGFYNPYKVQRKMFEFFDTIENRKPETPWSYNQNVLLPQLLCDWLMGTKTNSEILTLVEESLKKKKYKFSKKKYYKLTKRISEFMFSAERLANTIRPIKQGIDLLKRCKRKDHQIYILSNWDPESFQELYKQKWFKEMLDLCDGCVISGDVHMIKPDPEIFEHLFETYELNPDETVTVYIDDARENILGAKTLKKKQLFCFECQNKKFDSIIYELQQMRII